MPDKWTALGMKKLLADKGDDIDETLEEWADALAEKSNTWERMAWMALGCVAFGVLIGWWFFKGTGCPDLPPVPAAVVDVPPAAAAHVPVLDRYVVGKEVKVHVADGKVVCEAHPPHGGK